MCVKWKQLKQKLPWPTLRYYTRICVELGKGKVVPGAELSTTPWSGGTAPGILTLTLDKSKWFFHKPAAFIHQKDKGLGGPQSVSGGCGEEKNPVLLGIKSQSSIPWSFPGHNLFNIFSVAMLHCVTHYVVEK